jgi:hypothetical protein
MRYFIFSMNQVMGYTCTAYYLSAAAAAAVAVVMACESKAMFCLDNRFSAIAAVSTQKSQTDAMPILSVLKRSQL